MAFNQYNLERVHDQSRGGFDLFVYHHDTDTIADITASGYFDETKFGFKSPGNNPKLIKVQCADGPYEVQLVGGVASVVSSARKLPAITVLVIGQSNARGRGDASEISQKYNKTYENVYIYNGNQFVNLSLSTNEADSGDFGVEMSLAYYLSGFADRINIIKRGISGCPLDYNPSGNSWYPYGGNVNEDYVSDYLIPALGSLDNLGPVIMYWAQGEADSKSSNDGFAERYESNLFDLIAQMNSYVTINKAIIAKLNSNLPSGTYDLISTVQDAQSSVCDLIGNCELLDLDNEPLQGDNIHYTSAAFESIGKRVAVIASKVYDYAPINTSGKYWKKIPLIDFRQESSGGSTSLATALTSSTLTVEPSAALGLGLSQSGKSANGGLSSIAISQIDNFKSRSAAVDIELLSGSALGGPVFCGGDNAGAAIGYIVRVGSGVINVYELTSGGASLLSTLAKPTVTNEKITIFSKFDNGTISLFAKYNGELPIHLYSENVSNDNYGENVYVISGFAGSNESQVRFGNVRPVN